MKKTLISFVGSGRRNEKETETYKRTDYVYGDAIYSTAIFTEALIEIRKNTLEECVLIGTQGSAWGSLIEKGAYEKERNVDLFDQLEEAFDQKLISNELLQELARVLKIEWGVPVRCVAHISEINEESVLPILYQYVDVLIAKKNGFLVDITHAFRSMPLILMSAVQVLETARTKPVELEIVYGEYSPVGPSTVRSLAPMWNGIRFARALRRFNETFDGDDLASFVESEWPTGAKAIKTLGAMLQSNFVTQLDESLKQAANALTDLSSLEPRGTEVALAAGVLKEINRRLSAKAQLFQRIFVLAELLKERQLWGQAITTLQLSLEAFVFSYYDEGGYGDYDITKGLCRDFGGKLHGDDRDKFHRLRSTRNAIAHGGARSREGGKPQMQNLPSQYESYSTWLKRIFKKHG